MKWRAAQFVWIIVFAILLLSSGSASAQRRRKVLNRLERDRVLSRRSRATKLRPEFGPALSLLHATLLPVGEVSRRISGGRPFDGIIGFAGRIDRTPLRTDFKNARQTTKRAAAVASGFALAGAAVDRITPGQNTTQTSQACKQFKSPSTPHSKCSKVANLLITAINEAFHAASDGNSSSSEASEKTTATSRKSPSNSSDGSKSSSTQAKASRTVFTAQQGYVDFGIAGSEDADAPCQPNCAFTNPSSIYGLTVLPLNPREDLQSKLKSKDTQQYAKDNLDGRYGERMAPTWQLARSEVVVVAGCTPPEQASRYFGATGYLYSSYLPDDKQWLNVFASIGDTASVVGRPARHGSSTAMQFLVSSRLNTTAPVTDYSSSRSSSGNLGSFSAFTVVVMGADPSSVNAAAAAVKAAVEGALRDLTAASSASSSDGLGQLDETVFNQPYINVLAIPGPYFAENIGLQHTSNYYTLLVRNIAPSGPAGPEAFQEYVRQPFLSAWRLTPTAEKLPESSEAYSSSIDDEASLVRDGAIYPLPTVIDRRGGNSRGGGGGSSSMPLLDVLQFDRSGGLFRNQAEQGSSSNNKTNSSSSSSTVLPAASDVGQNVTIISAVNDTDTAAEVAASTHSNVAAVGQLGGRVRVTTDNTEAGGSSSSSDTSSKDNNNSHTQEHGLLDAVIRKPVLTGSSCTIRFGNHFINCTLLTQFAAAVSQSVSAAANATIHQIIKVTSGDTNVTQRDDNVTSQITPGDLLLEVQAAAEQHFKNLTQNHSSSDPTPNMLIASDKQANQQQQQQDVALAASMQNHWSQQSLGTYPQEQQQQQQQVLNALLDAIGKRYGKEYAVAYGLGSASAMDVLGVDWGLDCLEQNLDWCNGDNRDAVYLCAMPMSTLNRPGQMLLVVGVNYVASGLASYMNVAATDPLQQLGLVAFDDQELTAAAAPAAAALLASSTDADAASIAVAEQQMYVVTFSRECKDLALPCKTISTEGPKGVPLNRPLMTLSRVYVNPVTGVGPDSRDLVPFTTVLLTPKQYATKADNQPRVSNNVWKVFANDSIADQQGPNDSMPDASIQFRMSPKRQTTAVLNDTIARTSSGSGAAQANSVKRGDEKSKPGKPQGFRSRWSDEKGVFNEAIAQRSTTCSPDGSSLQKQMMQELQPLVVAMDGAAVHAKESGKTVVEPCVRSLVGMSQCSGKGSWGVCCNYVNLWNFEDCWCRQSGMLLLESMPAVLTPTVLQLLSWMCEAH